MNIKSIVLAGLAVLASASSVIDLIPSNFDNVVLKSGKPSLVEFFAPWCGHCQRLAPIYEELGDAFASVKDKVQIARVDGDAEKALSQRFKVEGFPTILWFDGKSDEPTSYRGARELEALSSFVTEKSGVQSRRANVAPSNIVFLNDATFGGAVNGEKDVLVAFTAPWCRHCKDLAPTWEKIANDFANEPNVVIAKVDADNENSKATARANGVSSYPTIIFYPQGSTEGEKYTGTRSEDGFITYLNEKAGTFRVAGGGLNTMAGIVPSLDNIVDGYLGGKKIAETMEDAKQALLEISDEMEIKLGEYYVHVLEKMYKTEEYASKELVRLEKMLAKGGLQADKKDELTRKANILRKFAEKDGQSKDEL